MKTFSFHTQVISILVLIFGLTACTNKKVMEDPKVLADTDRFYSAMSAEKGMNAAFIAMFDSAGVLLRANHYPIEGIDAIKALLEKRSDTAFTLTWEPSSSVIATSGDFGYTYGTFKVTDKPSDSISETGTYATIWKKQADGKWKAVLDTGNPGLGTEK